MAAKLFEPIIGKLYMYNLPGLYPLLVEVVEYPVMPEDHHYDSAYTVVKARVVRDGDIITDTLDEFCLYFREATDTEITLYGS